MTKDIWVISDTHFNHTNILKYGPRPFDTIQEHDEALIQNWNSVVKSGDKVYHLGDVYMGQGGGQIIGSILARLNGQKRLLLGNHDNGKNQVLQKSFGRIELWRQFKEFGLLLTHVPVHESTLFHRHEKLVDLINVHGHIHNNESPSKRHINVSCEKINYTPVNIEELRYK